MISPTTWFLNIAATGFMTGIIWFVQLVHYPRLDEIPTGRFQLYHRKYTGVMAPLVGPVMLIELTTAVLLWSQAPAAERAWHSAGLIILAAIWYSTIRQQIPCHQQLKDGYDPIAHRRLVATNWTRTLCWSMRLAIMGGAYHIHNGGF